MKSVHKSVLIWHSPQQMFDLVIDVERYPEFLLGCSSGRVLERTPLGMTAEVGLAFKGVSKTFVTRNEHEPPHRMRLHLVRGPFSHLEGEWNFTPVGEGACRIDFRLDYAFASRVLSAVIAPVFDRLAATFVDAFIKRADEVYGEGGDI
ncbi:MAG: type II toxin-antitoxin system RatA family toxin [Ottowia sp.]|nr:type II toxin-antitoxin system RatA family toxin [Ottowia sp.]